MTMTDTEMIEIAQGLKLILADPRMETVPEVWAEANAMKGALCERMGQEWWDAVPPADDDHPSVVRQRERAAWVEDVMTAWTDRLNLR